MTTTSRVATFAGTVTLLVSMAVATGAAMAQSLPVPTVFPWPASNSAPTHCKIGTGNCVSEGSSVSALAEQAPKPAPASRLNTATTYGAGVRNP